MEEEAKVSGSRTDALSPTDGDDNALEDAAKGSAMGQSLLSLATLAGRRRKEAQEALLEKVAGLLGGAAQPSEKERMLIDEILIDLVGDVETAVRARLAEQVAEIDTPPERLYAWLLEDEAPVAKPIILGSPILKEGDLLKACERSHGHRLAAAARPHIGRKIGDALVSHGESDVALVLLRNATARISQDAFARIIARMGDDPLIGEALAKRPDLSSGLAHQLFWAAAGKLRPVLLERFQVLPEHVDRVLEELAADGYGGLKAAFDEVAVLGRDRLAQYGPISAALGHLRSGNLPAFARDAARRLKVAPQTIARVLGDPGGEAMAVICRALDLDRSQFTSLFLLLDYRRQGQALPAQQLEQISRLFDTLGRDQARATMQMWDRVDLVAVD